MSIYYSGTFKRSAGVISAVVKQLNLVNLKPVKKFKSNLIHFTQMLDFLFHISSPKVAETNLNCVIKTNIVCDRSEPQIKIDLNDAGSIKFLANNLTVLEILQQINKHISSQVKEESVNQETTKARKKQIKR
ncbi:hypothetical protein NQ318_022879 [Aromia moschata]|uniref:Large ribosomal subunit protein mL53 n=1 Tax=Aromia moschata TaxID=1265417 RepID=A0AAV8XHR6_9CUCU|nr:hypothetical protein NQ318_022879 [Aromia moschata]